MTDVVGPFDTASWSQEEWFRHMLPAMPSGVIDTAAASATTGGLALLTSGRNVGLDQGRANVGGAGFYRTGAQTANLAVSANTNSTLQRRDRLVLRRSLATNTVAPFVITGTASATPTPPALTRSDTTWDLPMFSWLTPPASGTTLTGIQDERRWLDPVGTPTTRGLVGYGVDGTTVATTSSTGTRPTSSINFTVHLYPGRIYLAQHNARAYTDVAGTVASLATRISKATASAVNSDPILCQSTAVLSATTSGNLFSLRSEDWFTVGTEDDYVISAWVSRALGSGTVNLYPTATGRYTQAITDVREAATSGPSGLANVVQAI